MKSFFFRHRTPPAAIIMHANYLPVRPSTLLPTLLLLLLALLCGGRANAAYQKHSGEVGGGGYVALDKTKYDESESITVNFALPPGGGGDGYDAWSVGLFMRDADPQGGTLPPIVSILVRDADGCARGEIDVCAGRRNVTFGDGARGTMRGAWPVEVKDYGVGFDAWVLDGRGAAAIGPAEFGIRNRCDGQDEDHRRETANGLLMFNKGIKRSVSS